MSKSNNRVQQLISGRRAGTVSMETFKARIDQFSTEELAELAATLLETNLVTRRRLQRELVHQFGHMSEPA